MKPNVSTLFDCKVLKIHRSAFWDNRSTVYIRQCHTGYTHKRKPFCWENILVRESEFSQKIYILHMYRNHWYQTKMMKDSLIWPIRDNFITIVLYDLCVINNYCLQYNLAPTKPFSTWQVSHSVRVSYNAVISLVCRTKERKLPIHIIEVRNLR